MVRSSTGEQADLSAGLDRHVGDDEPVRDRQSLNPGTIELQRHIRGSVSSDGADKVQHQVFRAHRVLKATRSAHPNVSGTRNQFLPNAIATATSLEPMPVPKAPSAPAVTLWESEPTTTVPGRAYRSATSWWHTPSPTSLTIQP